jgi:hypothetical protein
VPLPLNAELPKEQRDEVCTKLKEYMLQEERLLAIVRDLQLTAVWSQPSEEAAAAELKKRIFIRIGDATTPMGEVPALHVGLSGTRKDKDMTQKIVGRMMDNVKVALGLPDMEVRK